MKDHNIWNSIKYRKQNGQWQVVSPFWVLDVKNEKDASRTVRAIKAAYDAGKRAKAAEIRNARYDYDTDDWY